MDKHDSNKLTYVLSKNANQRARFSRLASEPATWVKPAEATPFARLSHARVERGGWLIAKEV